MINAMNTNNTTGIETVAITAISGEYENGDVEYENVHMAVLRHEGFLLQVIFGDTKSHQFNRGGDSMEDSFRRSRVVETRKILEVVKFDAGFNIEPAWDKERNKILQDWVNNLSL